MRTTWESHPTYWSLPSAKKWERQVTSWGKLSPQKMWFFYFSHTQIKNWDLPCSFTKPNFCRTKDVFQFWRGDSMYYLYLIHELYPLDWFKSLYPSNRGGVWKAGGVWGWRGVIPFPNNEQILWLEFCSNLSQGFPNNGVVEGLLKQALFA